MTEANQEFTVSGQLKKITILDSTLRDGAQGEGISFSVQDKINIVKALDELGVAYIEAGNPGSTRGWLSRCEKTRNCRRTDL